MTITEPKRFGFFAKQIIVSNLFSTIHIMLVLYDGVYHRVTII